MTTSERAIQEHGRTRGKFGTISKMPLNTADDLSIAYTPGVGAVSKAIAENPELQWTLTSRGNVAAIISDGSAVLGLGNIGPAAAGPVMEGKTALLKKYADIDGVYVLLNTQDTEEIIRTIKNIALTYGVIILEDISAPRCFEVESRLQKELPIAVFHDDQHGTAMVVLGALLNALKVAGKSLDTAKIVINGSGAAGTAIAKLLIHAGAKNLVMLDTKGTIYKGRDGITGYKLELADITNPEMVSGDLSTAMKNADVFIGVSKGGLVNGNMVKSMADKPVVFALANPEPEIMPDEALAAGAIVVATGRNDFPNQINNVLIFPGFTRGLLDSRKTQITPGMQLAAARALAGLTPDPAPDMILPGVFDQRVVPVIASAVVNFTS